MTEYPAGFDIACEIRLTALVDATGDEVVTGEDVVTPGPHNRGKGQTKLSQRRFRPAKPVQIDFCKPATCKTD